ncbi:glycosyltransferase 87 family protein [Paenibacillus sp. CC-CFT747]|nr:glycosyltransferase 87 family protein [Paenibacillus sp. CC-CFT747]
MKPNTTYRLSGFLRAEQADPSAKGANLSVIGPLETSADYKDTKGEWQYVELYGRTGPEQNELKVAVRLGGYGSLTKGTAYFDDIAFEEVSQVPAGVKAISFLPQQAAPAGDPATSGDPVSPMKVMLFTVLFGALFVVVYQSLIRSPLQARGESRYGPAAMASVLGLGLFLRLYIGQHIVGHPTDVNTFTAWAKHAAEAGLMRFYDGIWADYPPGYIYVLYAIGKLAGWMHLEASSKAFLVLLKLPAILADLAAAWLVYRLAQPRFGDRAALGLSLLYAFNPAVIADSAAWGQVDSVFTLLLLATLLQVVRGRIEWACVLFALTVLIKPQALIFTPALLYAFIRAGSWKRFGVGALWGLAGLVIPLVPFSLNQGSLLWVVDLYKTTLKSYPYATLNAFNLYSLVGANWKPTTEKLLFLPYSVWGNLFIVAAVGLSAYLFFRRKEDSPAKVLYTALILIAVVFLLAAKMHERYLYPAVALVLVAYVYARDRRLLWLFLGFSLTAFINIGYVLAFSLKGITNVPAFDGIMLITSLANLVLLGWLIQVGVDLFVRGRIQRVEPVTPLTAVPAEAEASGLLHSTESAAKGRKFTRRDWIGMGAVTAIYAVVALYNLGSFSAPQTFWQPARTGDSFYVDLGESRTIERINTFSEIGEGKFKLEFGDTPTAWTNPLIVDNTYVKVFLWNVQPVNVKARYVKVTVDSPGFTLDEMALFEKDNEEPLPSR